MSPMPRDSLKTASHGPSPSAPQAASGAVPVGLRGDPAGTLAVVARFALYSLCILVLMLSLPLVARSTSDFLFREGGPVEWAQFALLLATCALCLLGAASRPAFRGCLVALATAAGVAAVRELDSTLDRAIRFGGWKLPAALVLLAGAVAVYRYRSSFRHGAIALLHERSFALMWCGLVIAVPFAQLAGHGPFLELVLEDAYNRSQKRLFEELGELIGYVLVFSGTVELMLSSRGEWTRQRAARFRSSRAAPPRPE